MYAQLGNYKFENLIGPESLSKTSAEKYASHDVIDGKPILQHIGSELDGYRISVLLHSRFCIPEDEINALNQLRTDGEVLPFSTGAGNYEGDYVIESISVETYKTDANGNIIEAVVSIVLTEYVESNPKKALSDTAVKNAFATDLKRLVPIKTIVQSPSAANDVLSSERNSVVHANAILASMDSLETNPSKFQQVFASVKSGVDIFKKYAAEVNDKFQKYQNIKDMVENAEAVMETVIRDAETLKTNIINMDLSGSIQASKTFGNSVGQMEKSFGPVKTYAAARGVLS